MKFARPQVRRSLILHSQGCPKRYPRTVEIQVKLLTLKPNALGAIIATIVSVLAVVSPTMALAAEVTPMASPSAPSSAAGKIELPDQHGLSVEYGYAFDPKRDISFTMFRFSAVYDYGTVWHQDRPKALRHKVEAAAGSTMTPENDFMASANMLALYYPWLRTRQTVRPYVEAGIGVIYTELRVKGQGLHWNFNPLLGIGCELPQQDGKNPFAAIRLHHLSNGGIVHDNRGVNSVEFQFGRFF